MLTLGTDEPTYFDNNPSSQTFSNNIAIPIDELRTLVTNSSEISETTYAPATEWIHFQSALKNAKQLVESTHLLSDFKLWHQIFKNAESCCEVKKASQPSSVPVFLKGLNAEWRELRESYASLISHRSEAYEEHPEITLTYKLFADAVDYHKHLVYAPFRKDFIGDSGTDQIIADHVKSLDQIRSQRRWVACCSCFGLFSKRPKDKINGEATQSLVVPNRFVSSSSGR